MSVLHIILDDRKESLRFMQMPESVYHTQLPLPDGLENKDVYEIARKLAELLLETMER